MRIQSLYCWQTAKKYNKLNYQQKTTNFCANELKGLNATEKLIANFLSCEKLNKYKLSWKDAVKMCNYGRHEILTKQGSHAELRIADGKGVVPIVMPHEGKKFLSLLDKKRIRAVLTGDLDTAFRLH